MLVGERPSCGDDAVHGVKDGHAYSVICFVLDECQLGRALSFVGPPFSLQQFGKAFEVRIPHPRPTCHHEEVAHGMKRLELLAILAH